MRTARRLRSGQAQPHLIPGSIVPWSTKMCYSTCRLFHLSFSPKCPSRNMASFRNFPIKNGHQTQVRRYLPSATCFRGLCFGFLDMFHLIKSGQHAHSESMASMLQVPRILESLPKWLQDHFQSLYIPRADYTSIHAAQTWEVAKEQLLRLRGAVNRAWKWGVHICAFESSCSNRQSYM